MSVCIRVDLCIREGLCIRCGPVYACVCVSGVDLCMRVDLCIHVDQCVQCGSLYPVWTRASGVNLCIRCGPVYACGLVHPCRPVCPVWTCVSGVNLCMRVDFCMRVDLCIRVSGVDLCIRCGPVYLCGPVYPGAYVSVDRPSPALHSLTARFPKKGLSLPQPPLPLTRLSVLSTTPHLHLHLPPTAAPFLKRTTRSDANVFGCVTDA